MAVKGSIAVKTDVTNTASGATSRTEQILGDFFTWGVSDGTTSNKADLYYADKQTALGTSSTQSYDLSGTLSNGIGVTSVFAKVKLIALKAATGNSDDVVIDGGIANAFTDYQSATAEIKCPPGGVVVLGDPKTGFTVTAGTGDILAIKNSSGAATAEYELLIIGTSA